MAGKTPILLVAIAVSAWAQASSCDDVVGQWSWFTGGVVTIKANGAIVHTPNNDGTWKCVQGARTIVTLRWRVGGFVNTMELSANGKKLSSTDPSQAFVTGTRIGATLTSGKAPASPGPTSPPAQPVSLPAPAPTAGAVAAGDLAKAYESFEAGRRQAAAGRCREAAPHFNEAIRLNPRHAKAYSDRGRCAAILGQLSQGLLDLDRAVQLSPNDMSSYFNRAGLRADAGDGNGALADLDRSVQLDPMNPASRVARGALLEVAGRTREAQADIETAYRQVDTLAPKRRAILDQVLRTWRRKTVRLPDSAPTTAGSPMEAAAAAMRAGKPRAALAILDAAQPNSSSDAALLGFRARLRLDLGQAARAVEDLTAFLASSPNAYAFTDRGRAYRQLCRFGDELADYDRAARQDPTFSPAYVERAFTMMHFHKGDDPTPYLTKAIELDPQNWRALYLRGQEYGYWNNKLHLAMADYRRVVQLKPDFAQAYCNMAFALREAQRMQEVDGWLQKCYALDPSEQEVTRKVFAKIQAKEEQAARDMAAMANWDAGGEDPNDPRVFQKKGATNSEQCAAASGNWTGAYGCK